MGTCTAGIGTCCGHDSQAGDLDLRTGMMTENEKCNIMILSKNRAINEILNKHIAEEARFSSGKYGAATMHFDMAERRKQLEKAVVYSLTLNLKIVSNEDKPVGQILTITPLGYVNSKRTLKDGSTFFGTKKRRMKTRPGTRKSEIINDVVLKRPELKLLYGDKMRGPHFRISFSLSKAGYLLRDMGKGFGVFMRLDNSVVLRDMDLVKIGGSYLIVNLMSTGSEDNFEQARGGTRYFCWNARYLSALYIIGVAQAKLKREHKGRKAKIEAN